MNEFSGFPEQHERAERDAQHAERTYRHMDRTADALFEAFVKGATSVPTPKADAEEGDEP